MLVAGPHFRLLTLGVPMLVSAAGEVVRYRTRKHFALLIRLALEPGRKFVRDYLIDLLWPDATAERGRHSLSQAITVMRTTVGREFVAAHRNTLALNEGVIDVDALRLESCDAEIRGRFLEGFDLRGARGFDEWREGWSARLHPKIRDCLVKHMDAARRLGDFATVERHALVLEDLDPLSEDALRGIMEARAWVGDRSNALKAFQRFSHRMEEELGAKPSPEVERMAGLLREGRRAAPRPTAEGPPPREERRFEAEGIIGREREFSVLYDAWLEVRQRKPRVMVVLGDPGIGKTTLTNSFVSSCQMEGAVIARAQAYDAERELPYAVLAELVRQLTLQRAIGGAEPEALAELSRLTPDILAVFPGVPSPAEWPPEVVPLRFADAFLKAVTAAADDNPVVLVVDDIHAADNASVGILHMLARKLSGLRLMLILAGRTAELRSSGTSSTLVTDTAVDGLRTIQLEGFAADTGAALVARIGAGLTGTTDLPPVDRILRASAGNPLVIELLTREWAGHGSDAFLRQIESLDALPAPTLGIPIAVRTVFERLTRRLDLRTRGILDLAAVLGRRVGNLPLYRIVGCSPGEAAVGLTELLGCGLIREVHGQLEFRNELIRAQAYYNIVESVRKELHQRVAELFEEVAITGSPLETVWHFLRAGSYYRALPKALAGAEECITVGAPSEAEQLLSIFPLHDVDNSSIRRLRILLVRALLDQSKATEAIPILETLSVEDGAELTESAEIALLRARAEQLLNRENWRVYGETATRALAVARVCNDSNLLVRALFESARAGAEIGDERMLHSAYQELSALVIDTTRRSELHDVHYALAFCESALGRAFSADKHIRRAIEVLGSRGSLTLLSRGYNGLGVISLQLCEPEVASQALAKALQLANSIGDDSRASTIAANMCTGFTLAGNYGEALSIGNLAVERGMRVPNQPIFVTTYSNMIDAYILTGKVDEARACLNAAREWLRQERSLFARQAFYVEATSFALMTGSIDEFLDAFGVLEKEGQGRSSHFMHGGAIPKYAARRDAVLGKGEEAIERLSWTADQFRGNCPLNLIDALAAKAWLEALTSRSSSTRSEVLRLLDQYNLRGKRAMLQMEGFLDERPSISH